MGKPLTVRAATLDADMTRAGFSAADIAIARRVTSRLLGMQRSPLRVKLVVGGRNVEILTDEDPNAPRTLTGAPRLLSEPLVRH